MTTVAVLLVALGIFLVYCAVKGLKPQDALKSVLTTGKAS